MSHGARNWPFLTFTGRPASRARQDQVRLSAEERRDLEEVQDLGSRRHIAGLMDVREHGAAERRLHATEDPQPLPESRAPVGLGGRAVGLVVGRLVDEGNPGVGRDSHQSLRRPEGMRLVLDGARAREERQRVPASDPHGSDRHGACCRTDPARGPSAAGGSGGRGRSVQPWSLLRASSRQTPSPRNRWRSVWSDCRPAIRQAGRSSDTERSTGGAPRAGVPAPATSARAARRQATCLTGHRAGGRPRRNRRTAGAAPRGATGTRDGTVPR